MTGKQRQTLDYIKSYLNEYGFSPTYLEIAREFGVSENSGAMRVQSLIRRGFARKPVGCPRGIELTEPQAA